MLKYLIAFLIGSVCAAETVFEGYYRIESGGKHIGFAVQRWQFEPKSSQWILNYFVQTSDKDFASRRVVVMERFKDNLEPLEYRYRLTKGGKETREQVTFSNGKFEETFADKTGKQGRKGQLEKNGLLSASAARVLVLNRPKPGKIYSYVGMREEDALMMHGQIQVLSARKEGKHRVYQILDDFETAPLESWVLEDGEILRSGVPDKGVTSTLVKSANDAIGEVEFNRSELVPVFNEIPEGRKNAVARGEIQLNDQMFEGRVDTKYKQGKNALPLKWVSSRVSK